MGRMAKTWDLEHVLTRRPESFHRDSLVAGHQQQSETEACRMLPTKCRKSLPARTVQPAEPPCMSESKIKRITDK